MLAKPLTGAVHLVKTVHDDLTASVSSASSPLTALCNYWYCTPVPSSSTMLMLILLQMDDMPRRTTDGAKPQHTLSSDQFTLAEYSYMMHGAGDLLLGSNTCDY